MYDVGLLLTWKGWRCSQRSGGPGVLGVSFSLGVPLTARRVAGGSSRSMRVPVMLMSHPWSTSGERWQRDTEHQHDPESATTATVGSNFLQAPTGSELWHFLFVGEAFHVAARAPVSLVGDDRAWQAKKFHGRARAR